MKTRTHDRILKGASALCFSLGFARVRVEEIARYLGISKKTIYNHFESKDELFESVIEESIAEILEGLDRRSREPGIAFTEKLRTILDFVVEELHSRAAVLFAPDRSRNRMFRDRIVAIIREKVVELTVHLFREGKESGAVRNDIDPEVLSYVYMGLIEGTFELCMDADPPYPPEQLIREALRISLVGVLNRGESDALLAEAASHG